LGLCTWSSPSQGSCNTGGTSLSLCSWLSVLKEPTQLASQ
jgi:hypothetical protein